MRSIVSPASIIGTCVFSNVGASGLSITACTSALVSAMPLTKASGNSSGSILSHGGDPKGVLGRLDYIQSLGTTAIRRLAFFRTKVVQGPQGKESGGRS